MNPPVRCGMCARAIQPGDLRFALLWKIYADYDGIIDLGDELLLEKTLLAVEKGSARDLEEKVYMESRHILCPACREEILETLSSLEEMRSEAGSDEEGGEERNLH